MFESPNNLSARLLVFFMVCVALLGPGPIFAAEGKVRILVIETMPVPVVLEHSRWFQKGMEDLGYRNGVNAELIVYDAAGDRERAVAFLKKELQEGKPDLVVTFATLASQAAHQVLKGSDVPVVFAVVSDPVGAGLIEKVNAPTGANITGRVFTLFREIKINLAMRLLSQIRKGRPVRFGIIHSSYPSSRGDVKAFKQIAEGRKDVEFLSHEVEYKEMPLGLETMLAEAVKGVRELEGRVDYWWQPSGPLGEVKEYTEMLQKNSDLVIGYGNTMMSVEMGALMTVNPDFQEGGLEIARLADSILRGLNPAEVPVTAPESFSFGANLSTALKLGIAVPSDLMDLAAEHIYR